MSQRKMLTMKVTTLITATLLSLAAGGVAGWLIARAGY